MAQHYQPNPQGPHQRHPGHAPPAVPWTVSPYGQFPQAPVAFQPYYGQPGQPMGYGARPGPGPVPAQSPHAPPSQSMSVSSPTAQQPITMPSQSPQHAGQFVPAASPGLQFGGQGDPFAALASNPIANLGLAYLNQNIMLPSKVGWMHFFSFAHYKYYFSVSNRYVLNKIKIILCPFAHKNWKREEIAHPSAALDPDGTHHVYYRPPKEDVNAPDLYIPIMAFITYILLMGLALGVYHRFTPEVLSIIASSALVTLFLEVGVMRLGFYMVATVQTPNIFDLVAYCAYKYVGLLVDLAVGIVLGSNTVFYAVSVVNAFFSSVFMLRTVKKALTPSAAGGTGEPEDGGASARRNYFLLLLAVVQFLSCIFLVKNAIPTPVS